MLWGYTFQGIVLGGDGAEDEGKMRAGVCCLRQGEVKGCIRMGKEKESTSPNRPEFAVLEVVLQTGREEL
jgi:hypothetical protein